MAVYGLTTLDAVNQMLRAIKLQPVGALDTGGTSPAAEAEEMLDQERFSILAEGWFQNTSRGITEAAANPITVAEALRVDAAGVDFDRNVTLRGETLYDMDAQSVDFSAADIVLDIVRPLDYADLSPKLKDYIAASAALKFQRRKISGPQQDAYLVEEAAVKLAEAKREDWETRGGDILELIGLATSHNFDTSNLPTASQIERVLEKVDQQIQGQEWHVNREEDVEFALATTYLDVVIAGLTGAFIIGETVTGAGGATGTFYDINTANEMQVVPDAGVFNDGEVITGGTSGATVTTAALAAVHAQTESELFIPIAVLRIDSTGSDTYRDVVRRGTRLYDRGDNTFVFTSAIKVELVRRLARADLPEPIRRLIFTTAAIQLGRRYSYSPEHDGALQAELREARKDARSADARSADKRMGASSYSRGILGTSPWSNMRI